MANRIELFVDVDPSGRGAAAIRSIRAEIGSVSTATKGVADQGSLLGSVFAGNALYNYFKQATDAVIDFSKESVRAYGELVQDQRFLNSQIAETGVNFDEANKKVDEFDRRLTLTKSNAEKLYAVTLQFSNEVGKVGQADEFINKLSDILVSHGVSPEEEANITRSLLAGRATELGKVLGKNVATIEKEAAKAGGFGDFSKLDDATKKLLLFNEVLQEGDKYLGATDQRLKEADGTLAAISAAYDRAKESAGKFLIEQSLVGDVLREFVGISPEENVQGKFDAMQRRAEAEARRRADELEAFGDLTHRQAQLAKDPSRKFESFDFLEASINLTPAKEAEIRKQAGRAAEIARDEMSRILEDEAKKAEDEAVANLGAAAASGGDEAQKLIADAKANARARVEAERQARIDTAGDLAGLAVERHARLQAIQGEATAQREAFEKQYRDLFTDKKLDVVTLGFAEEQFQHIKGIFSPERQKEIAKGLAEAYKAFQREAATYLKGVRAEAEALFSHLSERYTGEADNPFVKIFTEADESARKLQKTFGILGQEVVNELQAVEASFYRQQTLGAQLDATLKATALFRQADAFLNPRGLSGQEEAAISILEKRLDLLKTRIDVSFKISAISGGLGATGLQGALDRNKEGLLGQEFRGLEDLLKTVRGRGAGDQEQRARIYERIAGIFEELSPDTQRRISSGEVGGRDVFLEAYKGIKDRQERRVKEEVDKARYLDEQVDSARDDVELIRRARDGGLDTSEADRRLLARLKELPENLLTPDLRGEGFDAASREAERQLLQQDKATKAVEAATAATDRLTTATDGLAKAIQDPRQRELLIKILNKSKADVRDDMYGSLNPLPPSPDSQ